MGDSFIRHIALLGFEKRFVPSQHYVSSRNVLSPRSPGGGRLGTVSWLMTPRPQASVCLSGSTVAMGPLTDALLVPCPLPGAQSAPRPVPAPRARVQGTLLCAALLTTQPPGSGPWGSLQPSLSSPVTPTQRPQKPPFLPWRPGKCLPRHGHPTTGSPRPEEARSSS